MAKKVVFAAADSVKPGAIRLKPSEFAEFYNTVVTVNAGFFTDHPRYVNTGIFKWEGRVFPFKQQESDEIYFVGSSAVGLDPDGNWLFYNRDGKRWPDDWPQAHSAIAGGHRLIEDGRIRIQIQNEEYATGREVRHAAQRHPRTAICLTQNSEIILLVADGRHDPAAGFSLLELAELLHGFGCEQALNLDGGGSSTMFIRGKGVVNHPSDNNKFDHDGERAVRTAIIVTVPDKATRNNSN
jgi:exopolysaccharide biosynthesis protein